MTHETITSYWMRKADRGSFNEELYRKLQDHRRLNELNGEFTQLKADEPVNQDTL